VPKLDGLDQGKKENGGNQKVGKCSKKMVKGPGVNLSEPRNKINPSLGFQQ
jgi:hypothetical protein